MKKLSIFIVLLLALSGCINDDASTIGQAHASDSNLKYSSTTDETEQDFGEMNKAGVHNERLDILDNYILDMKYDVNNDLLNIFANILNNEVAFADLYDNKSVRLINIERDGYKLVPVSYTLLDFEGDNVPELLVNTKLGSADFVYVFHYNCEGIRSFSFSNKQMDEPKLDGSFIMSSGAGDWGAYNIKFSDDSYVIDSVGFMETIDNANITHIYHIGDELVDEDKYMEFLDTYMNQDEPMWFDY